MLTYPVHNTRYLLYKNKNGHAKLPCPFLYYIQFKLLLSINIVLRYIHAICSGIV